MSHLRLLVNGARGRMGQAIIQCAGTDDSVIISGEANSAAEMEKQLSGCDVVIDFSQPSATAEVLRNCLREKKTLVMGTTGQTEQDRQKIVATGELIPLVYASNYSLGVNTLFWLTQKTAEILGADFDLEIVEMHHRLKKDAPSGTARTLAEILTKVRDLKYASAIRHGREGIVGERQADEIGMHAIRGGDVVGDHTVIFANLGERLELSHKASSRDTFARGSIHAAKWAATQSPGLYSMQNVLGLE